MRPATKHTLSQSLSICLCLLNRIKYWLHFVVLTVTNIVPLLYPDCWLWHSRGQAEGDDKSHRKVKSRVVKRLKQFKMKTIRPLLYVGSLAIKVHWHFKPSNTSSLSQLVHLRLGQLHSTHTSLHLCCEVVQPVARAEGWLHLLGGGLWPISLHLHPDAWTWAQAWDGGRGGCAEETLHHLWIQWEERCLQCF